jgi:TfoX/Sxy family transcriptional regulator of competence genes
VAYDEQLVDRVRERLHGTTGVVELKMFGGWGVTICGNMAVGVMDDDLIVRVGPDGFEDALARKGVRPFDFTGRSMTGWVFVARDAIANGRSLTTWVAKGVEYAQSLPAKQPKKSSSRANARSVKKSRSG